jgi:hypothetical protein
MSQIQVDVHDVLAVFRELYPTHYEVVVLTTVNRKQAEVIERLEAAAADDVSATPSSLPTADATGGAP